MRTPSLPDLSLHISSTRLRGGLLLLVVLGLALGTVAMRAQPVALSFYADGPGAVVVRCPPPYIAGQGLILNAQPLANARFVGWEDGGTVAERFLIVTPNATQFTALFADVNAATFLSLLGWGNVDLSGFPRVQYPLLSGRTKLTFALRARQSYQVFQATDLAAGYFNQIPFALSATGPTDATQRTAEAGVVNVWVAPPTDSTPACYRVRLEGSSNYPSLFFAQASSARPGAAVILYGEALTGTPNAWAGSNAISATSLSDNLLLVTMPSSPGSNFITVAINGFLALGGIPINITTNTNQLPVVSAFSALPVESGGLFQVIGANLTSQSSFFIDGRPVQVVLANGTNALLSVPANLGGARQLTVVNNGVISAPLSVNLRQNSYAFSPATIRGTKIYTWAPYQPNAYSFTPATEQGLRVYTWAPYQPGSYTYVPASIRGVRVYAP